MKKIIIILLTVLSCTANAQTMQQYMNDTRKLVDEGKYPEALKRTVWYYDHALEKEPAQVGVRNSFALSDWKKLGEKYPPALKALKDDRDKKTQLVITNGNKDAFVDVRAINRTLGENNKSVALFKKVIATQPAIARSCWFYVKDDLFEAKEYTIIQKYIGSPSEEFESIKRHYNNMMDGLPKIVAAVRPRITELAKTNFVNSTLKLIDYAKAVKDVKGAKYVQQQALRMVKSDQLNDAIKS